MASGRYCSILRFTARVIWLRSAAARLPISRLASNQMPLRVQVGRVVLDRASVLVTLNASHWTSVSSYSTWMQAGQERYESAAPALAGVAMSGPLRC